MQLNPRIIELAQRYLERIDNYIESIENNQIVTEAQLNAQVSLATLEEKQRIKGALDANEKKDDETKAKLLDEMIKIS